MGTWCSVVRVSSGFTSNVLAFSHFRRQRRNGIVCYAAHKCWCANELYYLFYYSVVAQMNLKYLYTSVPIAYMGVRRGGSYERGCKEMRGGEGPGPEI